MTWITSRYHLLRNGCGLLTAFLHHYFAAMLQLLSCTNKGQKMFNGVTLLFENSEMTREYRCPKHG